MSCKRFAGGFFFALIAFVIFNAAVWYGWTKEITDPNRNAGDLLRIGYIRGHIANRYPGAVLLHNHLEMMDYNGKQAVDMVTVGDSYSQGGGGGFNRYYQDYIATYWHLNVLNINPDVIGGSNLDSAPIVTLSKLITSGYLDIIKPKYLLLESSERLAVQRFTYFFDLKDTATITDITKEFIHTNTKLETHKNFANKIRSSNDVDLHFINDGNFKFIFNNIEYLFSDKALGSKVVVTQLNKCLFTGLNCNTLIFYKDDIKNAKLATPENIAEVNRNLNNLAYILRSKGITLIFMPVVNKLTLYQPFIKHDNYPHSQFFEELRKLPKSYQFIDTKKMLSSELKNGEKDLFHEDDTHWSWKASKAIFGSITLADLANAKK